MDQVVYPNIWSFRTKRFTVILDGLEEDAPDFSFDETGEAADKVARYEWVCLCFRVRVLLDGLEVAATYLGNSIYADPDDFAKEHRSGAGAYFPDMVREACQQAREEIARFVRTAPRVRMPA